MIRILVLLPQPNTGSKAGGDAWASMQEALRPLADAGRLSLERLFPCTQNALEKRLAAAEIDIVHFLGPLVSRGDAHYATLTLESSDRRPRQLNLKTFAELLPESVGLVVLQAIEGAGPAPAGLAEIVARDGRPASLVTPHLGGKLQQAFLARLYGGLATGQSIGQSAIAARQALAASVHDPKAVMVAGNLEAILVEMVTPPTAPPSLQAARPAPSAATSAEAVRLEAVRATLDRKRLLGEFDVFLCHHAVDKAAVKAIAERLLARGLLPWLDIWELQPGIPWMKTLQERLKTIKSGAVFVGASGQGPWQEAEIDVLLEQLVMRRCPVIPVLLPDAPAQPDLPPLLARNTWVDFRASSPDPFEQLVWGITGERPPGQA